ncbi:hypothetical protein RvY_16888 [Ramazzottius varieornatus]|uniref:Uncharacterized protein n=1 Tax=Ramazzottius varieornatus TaxID=947166 RepID=A0A1D1W049_RAMVA|nr:hypothetical protein RvY_16888 [Ramazzottius varieornatus]
MRTITDEEAFWLRHMEDQPKALALFARLHHLPWPMDGDSKFQKHTMAYRAFIVSIFSLFDHLIEQQCSLCEVCMLMPAAARILRRLALQKTSPTYLGKIIQLEMMLHEKGPRQVSSLSRAYFNQYFKDNQHRILEKLHHYVRTVPREEIHLEDTSLIPPPSAPSVTLHSIDDLETRRVKYQTACEELDKAISEEESKLHGELRDRWEMMQSNKIPTMCGDTKVDAGQGVELEAALFELELHEALTNFLLKTKKDLTVTALGKKYFPLDPNKPKVSVEVPKESVPEPYPTLAPLRWDPTLVKKGPKTKQK